MHSCKLLDVIWMKTGKEDIRSSAYGFRVRRGELNLIFN